MGTMEQNCLKPEIVSEPGEKARTAKAGAAKASLALATAIIVFSLLLFVWLIPCYVTDYATGKEGLSPRFFPYLIAGCLGLLGSLLFFNTLRSGPVSETEEQKRGIDRFNILGIATFFLYYFAVILLGLAPASFLAMLTLTRLFGLKSWPKALLFSAVFVTMLFFFFEKAAMVPIPRGVFFDGLY